MNAGGFKDFANQKKIVIMRATRRAPELQLQRSHQGQEHGPEHLPEAGRHHHRPLGRITAVLQFTGRDQSYGSSNEFRDRYPASSRRRRLHRHAAPLPLVADRADVRRPGDRGGGGIPVARHLRVAGGDAHHSAADFRPPGAHRGQHADAAAPGADAAGNPQPRQSLGADPAAFAGPVPQGAPALSHGRHRPGYAQQGDPDSDRRCGRRRTRRFGLHHLVLLPGPV